MNNTITIQDVVFAFATAMDLSVGEVEDAIKDYARQNNWTLSSARDWLDVADELYVKL